MTTTSAKPVPGGANAAIGAAAILYHPDGYVTQRGKLMGRHAAGEGFLAGIVRHGRGDVLHVCAEKREHFAKFRQQIQGLGSKKRSVWLPENEPEQLGEVGGLYVPGPTLGPFAWRRRFSDPRGWSLSGVTHTICTDRVMDALGDLLTAPLEDWDALICTSPAVRQGVEHIQQAYGEYLAERLGLQAAPRPRLQLPVIPLGVDCEALEGGAGREAARRQWREKLRIADGDLAVLFLGRLSFHAKAHPMPMYLALEQASHATGARLHVIHAGWFANEWIKGGFEQGWKAMCPSVRAVVVDGRDQAVRDSIWHAADIFCSLSDNIQETFGLTPVEAMAAGLPVVASDWDGYRGTVEHGHTGFLVPTTMPGGGNGLDLVYRYFAGQETYDQYVGRVSQCIAVDVTAAATAFIELIRNPALRRELGERGKQRARRLFDWSVVIGAYEDLWQELAQRRRAAAGAVPAAQRGSPLRGDPFGVFSHYATQLLDSDARLGLAVANPVREFQQRAALRFNAFARDTFLPDARIRDLFRRLRVRDGATVAELASELNVTAAERPVFTRTVAWLMKLGIVRLHPGVDPDTGHRG